MRARSCVCVRACVRVCVCDERVSCVACVCNTCACVGRVSGGTCIYELISELAWCPVPAEAEHANLHACTPIHLQTQSAAHTLQTTRITHTRSSLAVPLDAQGQRSQPRFVHTSQPRPVTMVVSARRRCFAHPPFYAHTLPIHTGTPTTRIRRREHLYARVRKVSEADPSESSVTR